MMCPLCNEIFKNAVVTYCGHTFCEKCILFNFQVDKNCPICKKNLKNSKLYPNYVIRNTKGMFPFI